MIMKLQPVFFDKIWGGQKLRDQFGYHVSDKCGECWGISAHSNGSSTILNGIHQGKTLRDLYQNERQLFGDFEEAEFPILVKLIDASENLSIQVHPDNNYAKKSNSLGKEECWYILDSEENTEIIIGHKAQSKEEFETSIYHNSVESLVNSFPVHKGDFFYIKAGVLHAICKGTTLLEVQQSSDLTYRVYDYNRLENGLKRQLHIKEALDVLKIPDIPLKTTHENTYFNYDLITTYSEENFQSSNHGDYLFIIEGSGYFDDVPVQKGDFLMISANQHYHVKGSLYFQKTTF